MKKSLPIIKADPAFSLTKISDDKKFIQKLVDLDAKANNYGLAVTEGIAREIAAYRNQALAENERFELNSDSMARLTSAFLETRYIEQEDFAATIGEIINLFYLIKNETENTISDDDLISIMLDTFQNNPCYGSIENMQSKGLEKILREYKFGDTEIWDDKVSTGDGYVRDRNVEEEFDYDEDGWRE
ncbi:MAG: DUF6323 family protein [Oscillospiraceae bacterium]|nr:DUF6323 family protein [Oscillospiraceae bacterium]